MFSLGRKKIILKFTISS